MPTNQNDKDKGTDTNKGTTPAQSKEQGTNAGGANIMTPSAVKSGVSQDGGFNGNFTAQELAAKKGQSDQGEGVKPQVNVGQTDNPKYANMPQTDWSKVQKQEHVTAIKDKIDQDGLLGGKSRGVPHAVTASEAEQKDLDNDSDDEGGTDGFNARTSGSSSQRAPMQGSTPNATGSTAKDSDKADGKEANKAGTLGGGKK